VIFIEFVRGVPLITVLFMANTMLPLFVPRGIFTGQVPARAGRRRALRLRLHGRGGARRPAGHPKGQYEGAMSLGLGYWSMMRLIVLPQALKIVIPGIVNTFIGLFKDTTLVTIVGIFDLLVASRPRTLVDPTWATPTTRATGYHSRLSSIFCFGMSRYSIFMEKRLDTGHKR
jgi:general L-amino acid transport system permease protein